MCSSGGRPFSAVCIEGLAYLYGPALLLLAVRVRAILLGSAVFLKRTMVAKNGESTPRVNRWGKSKWSWAVPHRHFFFGVLRLGLPAYPPKK